MKENDWERYLREHRDELDVDQPDTDLIWKGIQQELRPARQLDWLKAAAAILVLIAVGGGMFYWGTQSPAQPVSISDIAPELAAIEADYKRLVAEKEAAVNLEKIDQHLYQEIFNELALLEQIQQEFRKDISQYGEEERLVKTLMKYYERKIRILEILSNEIDKKEYNKNRNHERSL